MRGAGKRRAVQKIVAVMKSNKPQTIAATIFLKWSREVVKKNKTPKAMIPIKTDSKKRCWSPKKIFPKFVIRRQGNLWQLSGLVRKPTLFQSRFWRRRHSPDPCMQSLFPDAARQKSRLTATRGRPAPELFGTPLFCCSFAPVGSGTRAVASANPIPGFFQKRAWHSRSRARPPLKRLEE